MSKHIWRLTVVTGDNVTINIYRPTRQELIWQLKTLQHFLFYVKSYTITHTVRS